jgi:hypothetical protein
MTLPIPVVQALQVLTVLIAAPGINGVIAKVEARLQSRRGPRLLQPYFDIAKLFRKEALAPLGASWVFLAAPLIAMTCYLTVPLLIPVLTTFPLPLAYMGDILGGGFSRSELTVLERETGGRTDDPHRDAAGAHLGYTTDVVEVVERFLFRPLRRPLLATVRTAKRRQSGRLDAYLGYMLIAVLAVLAVVAGLA